MTSRNVENVQELAFYLLCELYLPQHTHTTKNLKKNITTYLFNLRQGVYTTAVQVPRNKIKYMSIPKCQIALSTQEGVGVFNSSHFSFRGESWPLAKDLQLH